MAHTIYGAAYDDALGDEIRVTVVATGLARQGARRQPIPRALEGGRCEEQIDWLLEGTPASIQLALQTVERLLGRAASGGHETEDTAGC